MLLYNTVPVKDTNPLSKRLLKRFGSLDGVLSATKDELLEVDGIGVKTAEMITVVGRALEIYENEYAIGADNSKITNYADLGEYLVNYYKGREERSIILLSFDNKMKLIAVDELYNLDFSSGGVIPKPFLDTTVRRSTSSAVIAHNHPFGPLCPTEGDRETNVLIHGALNHVGVFLAEHFIISGDGYLGFMNHMNSEFSQSPELSRFFGERRSGFDG